MGILPRLWSIGNVSTTRCKHSPTCFAALRVPASPRARRVSIMFITVKEKCWELVATLLELI